MSINHGKPLPTGKRSPADQEWLRKVNGARANRCCRVLPNRHLMSFTPAARKYFVDKKEASAGNSADLLATLTV